MLHKNIHSVTVRGLIDDSELTVVLAPEVESGVTANVVNGRFEHQLTFGEGTHLCMQPSGRRASGKGVIALALPRSMTLTLKDCFGKWVRPDGEVHQLTGETVVWNAA